MRKSAFAFSLALLLAACASSSHQSVAPTSELETNDAAVAAVAAAAPANEPVALSSAASAQDAQSPSQDFERDRQTLDIKDQRTRFLTDSYLERARNFMQQQQLDEAEAAVAEALRLMPDDPRAYDLLVEIRALRGDPVATDQALGRSLRETHELRLQQLRATAADSLRRAEEMIARNDYDAAIAELEITNNLINFASYEIDWGDLRDRARQRLEQTRAQRDAAARATLESEQRRALEELRQQEAARRDRQAATVANTLDKAITAFNAGDYDEAHRLADQALDADPRNEQARELKETAFKVGRSTQRAEYVEAKKEQYRRWQESMRELQVPWTDVITEPDVEFWRDITEKRSKRRGQNLSQQQTETERNLREQLRTQRVKVPPIQEQERISEVIKYVSAISNISMVVDPSADKAVQDAGKTFTLNLQHALSVEEILNLVTGMTEGAVTWTVKHDVVLVTTKEKARDKPIPVNHDVQDLVFSLTQFTGPRIDRIRLIDQLQDEDGGGPFGSVSESQKRITPEDLGALIQENVAVGTWSDEGISIEASPNGYVLINHTPEVQEQVKAFLNDLRRFNTSLVTIESKFMTVGKNWIQEIGVDFRGLDDQTVTDVTNGLEDMASRGLDNGGTGTDGQNAAGRPSAGLFYGDGSAGNLLGTTQNFFENPLGKAMTTVGGLTYQLHFLKDLELSAILRAVEKSSNFELINDQVLSVHNTQHAHVAVLNQRAYIQDFDVEVATFQAVADPQINVLLEGVVLDVRPTIHSDRKYLTLEIQPTVAKVVALRSFSTTLGGNTSPVEFELPEVQVQSVFTSAIIPDGGSIMLGGLSTVRNVERRAEVPWFARIPIVGFLFKQEGYDDENKSLMILIRARITDVYDEIRKIEARY